MGVLGALQALVPVTSGQVKASLQEPGVNGFQQASL